MHAAIVSIGDELALGQNLDTNSKWLASKLAELSIITIEHRTLPDDQAAIAAAVRELASRCDAVLMTGGLGPTADDLTREAMCDVLTPGEELVIDEDALRHLEQWFGKHGRAMPELNRKQAMRPAPMRVLANPHGTAPGLAGQVGRCLIFCMPGPPREMQPMFLNHVAPELRSIASGDVLLTAVVHEYGMGESVAAGRIDELMERNCNPLIGTTASESIVSARIRVRGQREWAQQQCAQAVAQVEQAWHPYAYGTGETTLADAVGDLLARSGETLVTAESCTGGWLGKVIVDRAGSSAYYSGGWVTYSNEMKTRELGVPAELIEEHGAVSAVVADAMARGALHQSGASYALAITGIAGPDGGTPEKPVGTVFISLGHRVRGVIEISTRHFQFSGDRTAVRDRSVKSALQMLRFSLLNIAEHHPLLWEVPRVEQTSVGASRT